MFKELLPELVAIHRVPINCIRTQLQFCIIEKETKGPNQLRTKNHLHYTSDIYST